MKNSKKKLFVLYMVTFSDLASFQLALIGIMVSVLTLVFAIVVGKRDELRTLKSINDTVARNRKVALENSLDSLTSFCRQIIIIIVVVLLLYLSSMVLNGVASEDYKCFATIDTAVSAVVLVWIMLISIMIWNKVNKD